MRDLPRGNGRRRAEFSCAGQELCYHVCRGSGEGEEVIWPCRRPGPAVDFPICPLF